MARINIDGIGIEYDLLGEPAAPAVVVTPGGRFSKDVAGLRELADALVTGGKRVLLWDRPNCGLSDLCFDAETESELHARTLIGLIRALDLGPSAVTAGSAGARVSLMAAAFAPECISHLVLWWISGGPIGSMQLANYYCGEAANQASWYGMEAVTRVRSWADQTKRNPRARETILAQDVSKFVEIMQRWALAFRPSNGSPIPGMALDDFKQLTMPTLIMRNGLSDVSHPRKTSDLVHELIPHSVMIDPPWPDTEWNDRGNDMRAGKAPSPFVNWAALAPDILKFTSDPAGGGVGCDYHA